MEHTPLAARLGLWRVTRHPALRRLHARLSGAGLFLAQLDRVVRAAPAEGPPAPLPDGVAVGSTRAAEGVPAPLGNAPLAPGDRVLIARLDGEPVGHCCLSDRPVYVPELRRRLRFRGAYLWRLYVRPADRGRGIGTALIARALGLAGAAFDAGTVAALVAPDNVPSRRAFARLGFEPVERVTAAGCPGREWHRRRTLADA